MEPQLFRKREIRDRAEIVNRAGVHCAGRTCDQKRLHAGRTVARNGLPQQVDPDAALGIDRNKPQVIGADAGQFDGLDDAAMRLRG